MTSYFVFYWFICKSPRLGVVPIFIFRYSNFSGKLKLNDDPSGNVLIIDYPPSLHYKIYFYAFIKLSDIGLISKQIFSFSLLIGEEYGDADDLLLNRLPAALKASKTAAARGYLNGVSYKRNTTARER